MHWFLEKIQSYQDRQCLFHDIDEITYEQLFQKIKKYEVGIKKVIKRGEIVAFNSDYSISSIAVFFALFHNQNIIVPITSNIKNEVVSRLNISGSKYLIHIKNDELIIKSLNTKSIHNALFAQLHAVNHSGLILFSSGTSGKPKAMVHDLDQLIEVYRNKKARNLSFLQFLMFDHIGGLNTLFSCISSGVKIHIPKKREPAYICQLIDSHKINILPTTPSFLNLIYTSKAYLKYNLSSIKLVTYGTEPMPESLLKKLKDVFPKAKLLQTFGTSETGIANVKSLSSTSTLLKISDINQEYKVVDGELWLKSKTQILGYLNSSDEKFTEDGWFKTGDKVEILENGYFKIVGRKEEIINVGGQKVLPVEVESVLLNMHNVNDVIVFSKKNPLLGNVVAAKFNLEKNESVMELKKRVNLFCKDKLDLYKIPVYIEISENPFISDRFKKIKR